MKEGFDYLNGEFQGRIIKQEVLKATYEKNVTPEWDCIAKTAKRIYPEISYLELCEAFREQCSFYRITK